MNMKYIDLKDKDENALNEMLKEKKLLLFKLKAKLKTMQLSNPNEIKETRRDIARINTALSALKNEVKA
jgi:large subunit ribosomal protein L29